MSRLNSDILIITPFWKRWSLVLLIVICITLGCGTIQIWQTFNWLRNYTHYVHERDSWLDVKISKMEHDVDLAEQHFNEILNNQKTFVARGALDVYDEMMGVKAFLMREKKHDASTKKSEFK